MSNEGLLNIPQASHNKVPATTATTTTTPATITTPAAKTPTKMAAVRQPSLKFGQARRQQRPQYQQKQQQQHPAKFSRSRSRGTCVWNNEDLTLVKAIQTSLPSRSPMAGIKNNFFKITYRFLLVIAVFLGLVSMATYRCYNVFQRKLPKDLADEWTVRFLDEVGRYAKRGNSMFKYVGVDAGSEPFKTIVNTAFSLLVNPLPWKRVSYRNIRASQDVYQGVPVSTYTPTNTPDGGRDYPTIVYFHGGGWAWLSVGVYDGHLKHIANVTNFKIIAVEYRKAPDHPFPAAYEDCLKVTKYVVQHARQLHVRTDAVVLAGDGAGGNLAASVANEMTSLIRLQVLINPALQMMNVATPSYQESPAHRLEGITSAEKEVGNWMRYGNIDTRFKASILNNTHVSLQQYSFLSRHVDSSTRIPQSLSNMTSRTTIHNTQADHVVAERIERLIMDSRFNPMFTPDVRNSPPAYVITAQYDVLRDEGVMYGQRLKDNGVEVEARHYWKGFHGFFLLAGGGWLTFEESEMALADLNRYLKSQILT